MSPVLEIRDLELAVPVDGVRRRVLRSVSLEIAAGEALGLVGESGSGKSMTARAVTGLLPRGAQASGDVLFEGQRLDEMSRRALAEHRSSGVALIPQDPRTSINPVHTVGDFLTEPLRVLQSLTATDAADRAVAALADVGIPDGRRRLEQYPHELSGGLLQRVMICAALLSEARLIVADEPTTALDVTTQSEVMAILSELRTHRRLAVLFITHDLELAAAVCDRIAVLYAGEIVEVQPAASLADSPRHPYTRGLLSARPSIDTQIYPLPAIPGRAMSPHDAGEGCAFAARCSYTQATCDAGHPALERYAGALVRCVRAEELGPLTSRGAGD
ncbi:MAG: ABC transporter ATP-binding protein [Kineosporiaceae bacterium]|nr:ABC transporter ATP-binding protein [Kineosporiaceae bacterium]